MTNSHARQEALETLAKLICDMPVAMLTTACSDHSLTSRPMLNVNARFDGDLWFFTHEDDPKVREIQANPQVGVTFADPRQRRYVSVSGPAELVRDAKHAEFLWTEECQRWFPRGLSDPKLGLLKIDVQQAEYWDEPTNVMRTISSFLGNKGEPIAHEKIDWKEKTKA